MDSKEASGNPRVSSTKPGRRIGVIFAGVVVLGLAGGIFHWMGLGSYLAQRHEYANRTPTFSGTSDSLKQTVIVPTLDTPCPPGKNVIWCSSFQLAWNEIRDNVVGAPLRVTGAEEVAMRLNAAEQSRADLDPKSFYAAGGWIKDGIVSRIRAEIAAKFPSHTLPDFNDYTDGILAYSYLTACVPFEHPFLQMTEGFDFTDSQGTRTAVEGFGLWQAFQDCYKKIREQVHVLYCKESDGRNYSRVPAEYALDLCCHSEPYQVIVAVVELKGSLAETIDYLRGRMAQFEKSPYAAGDRRFNANDVLQVPELFW